MGFNLDLKVIQEVSCWKKSSGMSILFLPDDLHLEYTFYKSAAVNTKWNIRNKDYIWFLILSCTISYMIDLFLNTLKAQEPCLGPFQTSMVAFLSK